MPSVALKTWRTDGMAALNAIASAHRARGGVVRGRRLATRELTHAFVILLCSQFQCFCRDLHTEAIDFVVGVSTPVGLGEILELRLLEGRKLDQGNPNPSNLGADFGRFGFEFWPAVRSAHRMNVARQMLLENLSSWRNAVAHRDFARLNLDPRPPLRLRHVQRWHVACDGLASSFDEVVAAQLMVLVGQKPW